MSLQQQKERSRSPRKRSRKVPAPIIDGHAIASSLRRDVREAALDLQRKYAITPCVALIEVGTHHYGQLLQHLDAKDGPREVKDHEQSHHTNFAELKAKMAENCGMRAQLVRFSESVTQKRLLEQIRLLMEDDEVHGILVELPLPAHLDETVIMQAIGPTKDADGFTFANLGRLMASGGYIAGFEPRSKPAVPTAILEVLLRSDVVLEGKSVAVIGRSNSVGAPVATLLTAHDCTVTVCHARTQNIEDVVRRSDIVVCCAGRPRLVRGSWLKPGAVVVDVGMNRVPPSASTDAFVGDVCLDEALKVVSKIATNQYGFGQVTFSILLRNVLNLARQSHKLTKIGVGPSGPEQFRCADKLVFPDIGLKVPRIYLPRKGYDLTKWCCIACDQYTSQPKYWKDVKDIVGDAPSTLHLIFPEVYLGSDDHNKRVIEAINDKMYEYDRDKILVPQHPGFVLVNRKTPLVDSRKGLVVALDLDMYSFAKGSQSLIRATEKTIEERLPPRIAVRENAPMESPHILVLIDDPDKSVIEPLFEKRTEFEKLYDFDLMKNSGHLDGWHVASQDAVDGVADALRRLACPKRFKERYEAREDQGVILFPVGDGNHSLATAKRCWEALKRRGADPASHPARHALVELINIHDPGMTFEPIHRLIFNVDAEAALAGFQKCMESNGWGPVKILTGASLSSTTPVDGCHHIEFRCKGRRGVMQIEKPGLVLEAATLTAWLDPYLAATSGSSVDYVHGEEVIEEQVASAPTTLAFLLPIMDKNDLVKTVVKEGVLPRKTFSMGAADEKRFYFECQRIVPEFSFYKSDYFRRGSVTTKLSS